MAEISIRRLGELVRAAFSVLRDEPDGLPPKVVIAKVEAAVPLTPYERSEYPNRPGVRRFDKILRFSTIDAVNAGWLVKDKGLWTLTPLGKQALDTHEDPEAFQREAQRLYRQWRKSQPTVADATETGDDPEAPAAAAATLEEAEETAWAQSGNFWPPCPTTTFSISSPRFFAGWATTSVGSHPPVPTAAWTSSPMLIL